jgi:hypothetical protein
MRRRHCCLGRAAGLRHAPLETPAFAGVRSRATARPLRDCPRVKDRLPCGDHAPAAPGSEHEDRLDESARVRRKQNVRSENRIFAGSFYGHGWFRTSDLSRVKRYVTPRENTSSACKSAPCGATARSRVLRCLRVLHGSLGHWSPPVAHSASRRRRHGPGQGHIGAVVASGALGNTTSEMER